MDRKNTQIPVEKPFKVLEFPKTKTVLWDHISVGKSAILSFSNKQPKIQIKEHILGEALHLLEQDKNGRLKVYFTGSVTLCKVQGSFSEFLNIKLDKLYKDPLENCFNDICVPVMKLYNCCNGVQWSNISSFFKLRVICSIYGIKCDIDLEYVAASTPFIVNPIKPIPILNSGLAKPANLLVEGIKTGFITMDSTKKIVLLHEANVDCFSYPLIGIWVSGVAMIQHPVVYTCCLRYVLCEAYENRLCMPPQPFMIVHFSPQNNNPTFYDCICSSINQKKILQFQLEKGNFSLTLAKVPILNTKLIRILLHKKVKGNANFNTALIKLQMKNVHAVCSGLIITNTDDFPQAHIQPSAPVLKVFDCEVPDLSFCSDMTDEEEENRGTFYIKAKDLKSHKTALSDCVPSQEYCDSFTRLNSSVLTSEYQSMINQFSEISSKALEGKTMQSIHPSYEDESASHWRNEYNRANDNNECPYIEDVENTEPKRYTFDYQECLNKEDKTVLNFAPTQFFALSQLQENETEKKTQTEFENNLEQSEVNSEINSSSYMISEKSNSRHETECRENIQSDSLSDCDMSKILCYGGTSGKYNPFGDKNYEELKCRYLETQTKTSKHCKETENDPNLAQQHSLNHCYLHFDNQSSAFNVDLSKEKRGILNSSLFSEEDFIVNTESAAQQTDCKYHNVLTCCFPGCNSGHNKNASNSLPEELLEYIKKQDRKLDLIQKDHEKLWEFKEEIFSLLAMTSEVSTTKCQQESLTKDTEESLVIDKPNESLLTNSSKTSLVTKRLEESLLIKPPKRVLVKQRKGEISNNKNTKDDSGEVVASFNSKPSLNMNVLKDRGKLSVKFLSSNYNHENIASSKTNMNTVSACQDSNEIEGDCEPRVYNFFKEQNEQLQHLQKQMATLLGEKTDGASYVSSTKFTETVRESDPVLESNTPPNLISKCTDENFNKKNESKSCSVGTMTSLILRQKDKATDCEQKQSSNKKKYICSKCNRSIIKLPKKRDTMSYSKRLLKKPTKTLIHNQKISKSDCAYQPTSEKWNEEFDHGEPSSNAVHQLNKEQFPCAESKDYSSSTLSGYLASSSRNSSSYSKQFQESTSKGKVSSEFYVKVMKNVERAISKQGAMSNRCSLPSQAAEINSSIQRNSENLKSEYHQNKINEGLNKELETPVITEIMNSSPSNSDTSVEVQKLADKYLTEKDYLDIQKSYSLPKNLSNDTLEYLLDHGFLSETAFHKAKQGK